MEVLIEMARHGDNGKKVAEKLGIAYKNVRQNVVLAKKKGYLSEEFKPFRSVEEYRIHSKEAIAS